MARIGLTGGAILRPDLADTETPELSELFMCACMFVYMLKMLDYHTISMRGSRELRSERIQSIVPWAGT
jgi:hypothetical protein